MIITFLCSICSWIFCFRINQRVDTTSEKKLRTIVNPHLAQVSKDMYEPFDYTYFVCDLKSEILYNNTPFSLDESFNLQEVLQPEVDMFPGFSPKVFRLTSSDEITGFVIYLIPNPNETTIQQWLLFLKKFWPFLVSNVLFLILTLIYYVTMKVKIIKPMNEISHSSRRIIEGNYDYEVVRTFESNVKENEIGDLIYSFELMRDELKEKQIREESLKQSQQELISCISHDLRTPISTIKAYVEALRDGIAKTPEQRSQYTQIILEKVNLLTNMINDLLEYSNAQLNQLKMNLKEIYFGDYYKTLIEELSVICERKHVIFHASLLEENPLVVMDSKRITEVFYNLLENSMKYRSDEPLEIKIEVAIINKHIRIRFMDNGIGIHEADLSRVFERFYRAEKSRTSSVPGSGLGLSICKYIVERHHGEIYCKSNRGCEIGFTIPLETSLPDNNL